MEWGNTSLHFVFMEICFYRKFFIPLRRMQIPELRRLQDILASFLGQPKSEITDSGQLQFNCPRCVDEKGYGEMGKYNLEVNVLRGVFKCWSCCSVDDDMKGPVKKLILRYGGREAYKEYESVVRDIRSNELYKLPEYKNMLGDGIEDTYLHLPATYKKVDLATCRRQVRDYLIKRNITQDIIDKFKIGYTNWQEEKPRDRNRIIIPSYNEDESLNYWVGRDFTGGKNRQKYNNIEGVKKTEIVFQESHIQWDSDITLVEGAIDCIYGNNTIALLGKTLGPNDETYIKLKERANANVIICLDSDTTDEEIMNIYDLLEKALPGRVRYIKMDKYKDFGEAYEAGGKKAIIELMKHQRTFDKDKMTINKTRRWSRK